MGNGDLLESLCRKMAEQAKTDQDKDFWERMLRERHQEAVKDPDPGEFIRTRIAFSSEAW